MILTVTGNALDGCRCRSCAKQAGLLVPITVCVCVCVPVCVCVCVWCVCPCVPPCVCGVCVCVCVCGTDYRYIMTGVPQVGGLQKGGVDKFTELVNVLSCLCHRI